MARIQDIRNLFKPNGSANASSGMFSFIEHKIKQTSFTFINKVIHTIYYIFLFSRFRFIFQNRCGNFKCWDKNVFLVGKMELTEMDFFTRKTAVKCTPNALIKRHPKIFKCRKATQKICNKCDTHTSVVKYFYSYLKWCNRKLNSIEKSLHRYYKNHMTVDQWIYCYRFAFYRYNKSRSEWMLEWMLEWMEISSYKLVELCNACIPITATNRSCPYNRHCPKNIAVQLANNRSYAARQREREDMNLIANAVYNLRMYGCACVVVRFLHGIQSVLSITSIPNKCPNKCKDYFADLNTFEHFIYRHYDLIFSISWCMVCNVGQKHSHSLRMLLYV